MAAILNTSWYINAGDHSTTGYYAITKWATSTAYTVGQIRRPLTAPSAANERVYICTVAGTSTTEPTWTFTKGAVQTGTVEKFQECTGQAALNGDATTSPIWVAASTYALGMIVMNTGRSGYFIASAISGSGTSSSSQPAGLTTPVLGATTVDNSGANQITWTCIKASGTAFTAWGAPFSYTGNCITATWGVAGDTFYIGSASTETQAATTTLAFPGTIANPNRMYSVTTAGSVPPVAADLTAGASISTTAANIITIGGFVYFYGLTISCSTGLTPAALTLTSGATDLYFDTCQITIGATSGTGNLTIGGLSNSLVTFSNTTFAMNPSSGSSTINVLGRFIWKNTAIALNGTNTNILNLITPTASRAGVIMLDGVDFAGSSGIGSGKNIIAAVATGEYAIQVINCKIISGAIIAATPTCTGTIVDGIVTDSGATYYKQSRFTYQGTLSANTSVTNNATDGTTAISWQVVTTANAKRQSPFECFDIVQWAAAGTYAASLIQVTSATSSLLNSDIWVDVSYLGSASFPISSTITSGPATMLTAGSSLASGTWSTGGLGNNYKLVIPSFTTAVAGYVRFKVKVAKASLTINIDPAVTVA